MKAWKGSAEDVPGGTPPSTSSKTGGKNYEKTAQHPFGACTGHGCCFSKRMRKVFRKNEKSMLQNCNKKAKRKGRLQRVKKPM